MARQSRDVLHGRKAVHVIAHGEKPVGQPEGFRICPLGLQFYFPRKIPKFEIVDFRLAKNGNGRKPKEVYCSGVVVHCLRVEDRRMFRIWVKFLDLSKTQQNQIRVMARAGKHLCPYCMNF